MGPRQASLVLLILAFGAGLVACDDFKRHEPAAPAKPVADANAIPTITPPTPVTAGDPVPTLVASETAPTLTPFPRLAATAPPSADPQAKDIEASAFAPRMTLAARRRLLIRIEVLLDRQHFSPGVIDGHDGSNLKSALAAFEQAHGVTADGAVNAAALAALTSADAGAVTQDYVITADDVKGPFLVTVPVSMAALAKLDHVGYATPAEGLAEKFHMDEALLRALNPKADFAVAGTSLVVVRPNGGALTGQVARVEVDKTANQVRALDAQGKILAVFPATVGSIERPAPSGEWAVRAVAANPTYGYDPARLTFGDTSKGKLTIAAGPNNPVGSEWIDLTKDTYGIHGAPDPTRIGKTASHGCVRLTNWDAVTLGKAVKRGTPVVFVGAETKKA